MRMGSRGLATIALALALACGTVSAQSTRQEWRYYGGDRGGMRFSPLSQVNRSNVRSLERAWVYHTGELDLGIATSAFRASFSCTPLAVDGVLYLSTPSSRIIALDAETGKELWKFDPQAGKTEREFNSHRGVAYWEGPSRDGKSTERRILSGTVDGRLLALDAGTGKLFDDFGEKGYVDLRKGGADRYPSSPSWGARVTSAPAVYKDVVITGWGLPEAPGKGPSGDVRAFDVRTGKPVWTFHTVPRPGEPGNETWEGDSWKDRMGANVWSTMSVDAERGLVFLPVASPAYDFYGADRKGKNLYGNCVVALDAATGAVRWHFQTVHHDVWDYDLPAQPVLVTVRHGGRDIAAVAQVTKMGFVFLLDRDTGKPLFPVEERPVPKSAVPGEETWPTQPFPVKPAPLSRQTMTRDEVSTVTPESNEDCRKLFEQMTVGGLYTPAGLGPTLQFPGFHGGANWSGGAFDPSTGILFVNTNEEAAMGGLNLQPPGAPVPYMRKGRFEEYAWFRDRRGWPCQQPPWGTLNAVDLNSGEIVWRVPLGIVEELAARGLTKTGSQNLGGAIATAGGLVFIAATPDKRFRAFDAKTGDVLWEAMLEAGGHATPMTYEGPKSGRQYVVVAAGGGGFLRDLSPTLSDTVVAYALPKGKP
jgi:membrane-bound PQQ-dependent dehydrogenase (glucose/quinate/shikimate family)